MAVRRVSADEVIYDNTGSVLDATNVQDAIDTHLTDNNAHGIGDIGTRLSSLEETHGMYIYGSLLQIGGSEQDDLEVLLSKMPIRSLLSFHASSAHSALLGLESVGHYITIRKFTGVFASVQAINRTNGVLKINSKIENGFIGWKTIGQGS